MWVSTVCHSTKYFNKQLHKAKLGKKKKKKKKKIPPVPNEEMYHIIFLFSENSDQPALRSISISSGQ